MKKAIVALLTLPMLASCAPEEPQQNVRHTAWQISEVYVDPETPPAIPREVIGAAVMNFGGQSANGFTGCASFNGIVAFTKDGEEASPEDANMLDVRTVEFSPIDENQCVGKVRFVHDALVHMLVENSFDIKRTPDGALRMIAQTEDIDPQGFKLDSLAPSQSAE